MNWPLPGNSFRGLSPLFFRMIWKAVMCIVYLDQHVRKFMAEEVALLATWYLALGGKEKVLDAQLKSGWKTVWRLYENDIRQPELSTRVSWNPVIRLVEFDGYRFIGINTPAGLYAEGVAMKHCIADYTHECRTGGWLVYAISDRKTAYRIATLTVEYTEDNGWQVNAVFGARNKDVSERLGYATDAVCWALSSVAW